jgi:hypothetical protein
MPATFGIAAVSIAGMARSYGTRFSLFVIPEFSSALISLYCFSDGFVLIIGCGSRDRMHGNC